MRSVLQIEVEAGRRNRQFCPVKLKLSGEEMAAVIPKGAEPSVELRRHPDGLRIPCQVEKIADGFEIVWLVDRLLAGETGRYDLVPGGDEAVPVGVEILQGDEELNVFVDGVRFLGYRYEPSLAKPCMGPVIGPYGDSMTRLDFDTDDEPHQRSVWVAIGDVNGVDAWAERPGRFGRQLHRRFDEIVQGPCFGRVVASNIWTDYSGNKLVDETRTLIVYNTPAYERVFDIDIRFQANYGKVVFGATKEAGPLGIRVAESMSGRSTGIIENSYGAVTEKETWGKRAHWCDYSGMVEGHRVGIAVSDDPANERHPTYWHVRDYGLMAPNNFYFSGPRELMPSETVRFRYRMYIHTGNARQGRVAEKYHEFANPPAARVVTRGEQPQ